MRKKLLIIVIAALAIVGCRKEPDLYLLEFKANPTPRWENGATVEKNEETSFTFITDISGQLFSSDKYTIGRITATDGSDYEIIEFSGAPAVGKPLEPTIRKSSGNVPEMLHSLEILKIENGTLWIVFKETATSPERRVVQ
jgi:hypothetical protein